MKIRANKAFACPYGTGSPGTVVNLPDNIAQAMIETGDAISLQPAEPKHIGAGYYVMPDGSKVRGKEKAIKEMKKWQRR